MTLFHLALALGVVLLLGLVAASRSVERFIGWRYLFRRRRSRPVLLITLLLGALGILFPTLFLFGHFAAGSLLQAGLAVLSAITLMAFATFLFLNFFSVFTTISITGVFFGVATLVVVLSVTSGFQGAFRSKVLGVNAHVLVMKYGIDFSEYRDVMKKAESLPGVQASAPFVFHEMMVARGPAISGVLVKGILPGESERVLDIGEMLEGRIQDLGEEKPPKDGGPPLPGILLGKELAKKLKAHIGDRVRIIAPLAELDPSMWTAEDRTPKTREFRVVGVFYSGFDEYDRRLVLLHLKEGQRFVEGRDVVTGIELKTRDAEDSDRVAARLDAVLNPDDGHGGPYRVIDWRELNHNLFTALQLQKIVLVIVLTLIVLVAAFGIVATLTMLVIDKTREIAVLKSLGMRSAGVARVFQAAGLTIGALGTLAGIAIGVCICGLVSRFQYRLDPRVYLIDRLPVTVHLTEVLLTALITLFICLLATIYPALRAAELKPVEGLRYE